MQLRLGKVDEHLELVELERVPPDLPGAGDVRTMATLRVAGLYGSRTVWLAQPHLHGFIAAFTILLEKGTGSARLESMSPGELVLEITPSNARGDLHAAVAIRKWQYGRHSGSDLASLSGTIEIDAEYRQNILNDFHALVRL